MSFPLPNPSLAQSRQIFKKTFHRLQPLLTGSVGVRWVPGMGMDPGPPYLRDVAQQKS